MPSPFPGMDPYLESPVYWRDVHQAVIYCCRAALNAVLPPDFVARLDERLYVIEPGRLDTRHILPDVTIERRTAGRSGAAAASEATAVLEAAPDEADTPLRVRATAEEVREPFIEIVAVNEVGAGRVVTAIEVLSPANKTTAGAGQDEYRRKQRDTLRSDTHLLEIDLLRGGAHTIAAPAGDIAALRRDGWDYLVSLHRAGAGYEYEVWPRTLRERLPRRVLVPLTGDRPDVFFDLQAAFERVYDEGAFGRAVDYRANPDPPLAPEDATWADALLRERGLRP